MNSVLNVLKNSRIASILRHIWSFFLSQSFFFKTPEKKCTALDSSRTIAFCTRDGRFVHAWKKSVIARFINQILNFIPERLGKCSVMHSSHILGIVARIGENLPLFIGVFSVCIFAVSNTWWNNMYSLIAMVLLFAVFLAAGIRNNRLRFDITLLDPYMIAFFGFAVLAFFTSSSVSNSIRYLIFYFTGFLSVLLSISSVNSEKQLKQFLWCILIGLAVCAVIGILHRLMGIGASAALTDSTSSPDTPPRVYSTFENPNVFAEVLVLGLPVCIAAFLAGRTFMAKSFSVCIFFMGCISLIFTYSRAGWLSFALAVAIFVFFKNKRIFLLMCACALLALPLLPATVINRFLSIFNTYDTSISSRYFLFNSVAELIKDNWLFGVGLGSDVLRDTVTAQYASTVSFIHSHNLYLQIWGEMGIGGILAFLAMMFSAVKTGIKTFKNSVSPMLQNLSLACTASFLGILVFNLADYMWHYPRMMMISWLFFSIFSITAKLSKLENNGECNE